MNLSKLAVKRPVALLMCVMMVLVFGAVSLLNIPLDLMPEMNLPYLMLLTQYPGASPEEVLRLVTEPVEKSVSTVAGIKTIISQSHESISMVMMEFDFGADLEYLSLQVREKIDLLANSLPDEASRPSVMSMSFNSQPVSMIAIAGDMEDLLGFVNEDIIPQYTKINGVASVDVYGGTQKQVVVEPNEAALSANGLSLSSIVSNLNASTINMPAGQLNLDDKTLSLRAVQEFDNVTELANMPISGMRGNVVALKDVANVYVSEANATSLSRMNGQDCVLLTVSKKQSSNSLDVSKSVDKLSNQLSEKYPIDVTVTMSQGKIIEDAINSVLSALMVGGALAVLILSLFLGDIKASIIIATAIPFSVVVTFVSLYFAGISLNVVSLGGLSIGVGMMVDNSIVVLESIFRCRNEENMSVKDSAIVGTQKVIGAIIASTLTTVAVFAPIVFVKGITAEIFGQAALTISFSLASSLISAITMVPCMFALLNIKKKTNVSTRALFALETSYSKLIGGALKHRILVLVAALAFTVAGFSLLPFIGMEFIAATDEGTISISARTELGKRLESLDAIALQIEDIIKDNPYVEQYTTNISSAQSMMATGGTVTVDLKLKADRDKKTDDVVPDIRKSLVGITGCQIDVASTSSYSIGGMSGGGQSMAIELSGNDLEELKEAAALVEAELAKLPQVVNVSSSYNEGLPEAVIDVDALKAVSNGLSPVQVLSMVRSSVLGTETGRIKVNGIKIPIVVKYTEKDVNTIEKLSALSLPTPMGKTIALKDVAEIRMDRGPTQLDKTQNSLVITLSAQYEGTDSGSINTSAELMLKNMILPSSVSYNMGGNFEMILESFSSLSVALILAVLLVFMIMAAQFESMRFSFIVMMSIPLAFTGGAFGLAVGQDTLNIASFVGVIMLVGIVVNNAIVLIDCVRQLRENEGMERNQALIRAGALRLRPILMTALTTILGLVPLSLDIGGGAEIMRSMALVVIGGMVSSTLLTLIVIPVVYSLFDKRSKEEKDMKRQARKDKKQAKKDKKINVVNDLAKENQ